MQAVEMAPTAEMMRDFASVTSIHAARQKKTYGIRVVITDMVASYSK
jgi:hypothetical protein